MLRVAATGERAKEIAHRLGISERTVKAHLTSVYTKLGVDSPAAAIAVAAQAGWLECGMGMGGNGAQGGTVTARWRSEQHRHAASPENERKTDSLPHELLDSQPHHAEQETGRSTVQPQALPELPQPLLPSEAVRGRCQGCCLVEDWRCKTC